MKSVVETQGPITPKKISLTVIYIFTKALSASFHFKIE